MIEGVLVEPLAEHEEAKIRGYAPNVSDEWLTVLAALRAGYTTYEERDTEARARHQLEAVRQKLADAVEALANLDTIADMWLFKALHDHERPSPSIPAKELEALLRAVDLAIHYLGTGKAGRPEGQPYDPILFHVGKIGLPLAEKELAPVVEYVLCKMLFPPIPARDIRNLTRRALALAGEKSMQKECISHHGKN